MANLNFHQSPRSIAVGSLVGRGASTYGATASGHITPTSGLFQQGKTK